MWVIWTNKLLSKASKSCPKSNKSPNLVTLTQRSGVCFLIVGDGTVRFLSLFSAQQHQEILLTQFLTRWLAGVHIY